MKPVLFDTSVYITALRRGEDQILQTRNLAHGSPLWLSAVVLEDSNSRSGAGREFERSSLIQ